MALLVLLDFLVVRGALLLLIFSLRMTKAVDLQAAERARRVQIFKSNAERIHAHNAGTSTFTVRTGCRMVIFRICMTAILAQQTPYVKSALKGRLCTRWA